MRRWSWALPLLMAGCVPLTPTLSHEVELMVYPTFAEKTQSILNPNTLSTIATLDILPYVETTPGNYSPISAVTGNPTTLETGDALKLTQASPTIDPERPFVIRKLKPNKNYRVFGRAYNAASAQISQDASSFVDVAIANNDAPTLAQLPVNLLAVPFAASTSVTVNTEGRFEYLKAYLYLVSNNTQVAVLQRTRSNPEFTFSNLQGNTNYKVVVEAYKLGAMVASTSQTINVTNETAPATTSVSLNIPYIATTLSGNGTQGWQDGVGTSAIHNGPHGVCVDPYGNVIVGDDVGNRVRKVTAAGVVTTLAGSGNATFANGQGTLASFYFTHDVAVDANGNVFVADQGNHRIRKIDLNNNVTTFVGSGNPAFADGNGAAASFWNPLGAAFDAAGNLYVADEQNNRIRKVTPAGDVTTVAGNGTAGYADGAAASAMFNNPAGIAVDPSGTSIYVGDTHGYRVRKISGGVVSTIAGNGTAGYVDGSGATVRMGIVGKVAVDSQGYVYFSDRGNSCIRKISPAGVVTTIAGNGTAGFADGTGSLAKFSSPFGISVDAQGILYVGDIANHRIRKVQ